MPVTLLITQQDHVRRVAYLQDDQVLDVDIEDSSSKTPVSAPLDQIYWGRIVHVESSHAFVKFDKNEVGLLPLEPPFPKPNEGQVVLVQIRREAIPDKGTQHKGPILTRKIILGGRYCLFHPFQEKRIFSSKIQDPIARNRLQTLITANEPITLRESSTKASPDQIQGEIALLRKKFLEIQSLSVSAPCITPYDALPPSHRWMRDLEALEGNAILADNDDALKAVRDFLKAHRPDLLPFLQKHKLPLFDTYGLEEFWDSLFEDVVTLPSGGNIVIDVTTAAIVIDVNPGDKDAPQTNKEAIPIIIQQLKARHLGGNIIIDFIGLESSYQDPTKLKDLLLRQANNYNLPLDIFGWSKLGWMEGRLPKRRLPLSDFVKRR